MYIVESKEKIGSKETNEYLKFDMTEVFIQEMDVALHKQLKQIALENDVKLYELVEGVLRNYVEKKK